MTLRHLVLIFFFSCIVSNISSGFTFFLILELPPQYPYDCLHNGEPDMIFQIGRDGMIQESEERNNLRHSSPGKRLGLGFGGFFEATWEGEDRKKEEER